MPPAVLQPLAPARYKVQFTASAGLHDKLERLRALMRREVPDGDLAAIIEQAVTDDDLRPPWADQECRRIPNGAYASQGIGLTRRMRA